MAVRVAADERVCVLLRVPLGVVVLDRVEEGVEEAVRLPVLVGEDVRVLDRVPEELRLPVAVGVPTGEMLWDREAGDAVTLCVLGALREGEGVSVLLREGAAVPVSV